MSFRTSSRLSRRSSRRFSVCMDCQCMNVTATGYLALIAVTLCLSTRSSQRTIAYQCTDWWYCAPSTMGKSSFVPVVIYHTVNPRIQASHTLNADLGSDLTVLIQYKPGFAVYVVLILLHQFDSRQKSAGVMIYKSSFLG